MAQPRQVIIVDEQDKDLEVKKLFEAINNVPQEHVTCMLMFMVERVPNSAKGHATHSFVMGTDQDLIRMHALLTEDIQRHITTLNEASEAVNQPQGVKH